MRNVPLPYDATHCPMTPINNHQLIIVRLVVLREEKGVWTDIRNTRHAEVTALHGGGGIILEAGEKGFLEA